MRKQTGIAAIIAAAGMCAPAFAQDSVSNLNGDLPGDALSPWTDHCTQYVVDLSPITTSKGHIFGVAPIIKTSKTDSTNFNSLYSSSTISSSTAMGVDYSMSTYSLWENAPGSGVNALLNNPGTPTPVSGTSSQFTVAINDFGTTDGNVNFNGIIGAFVNYDPQNANRLYVDRIQAAINSADAVTGDNSQLGGLSIDANGNLFFRGDNSTSTGTDQISNNNIFRTRLMDRDCEEQNLISVTGTDATDALITNFGGIPFGTPKMGVPNCIPARIAGNNGLSVGTNAFDSTSDLFVADTGSFTQSPNHLDTTGGIGGDHRGAFGTTTHDFLDLGADYTLAILAKDAQPFGGETRIYNVTSVDSAGTILGNKGFEIPMSVTDNETGFIVNYTGQSQPQNYDGQTLFRGGVGQLAIGRDQDGRGLMAAMVNQFGFSIDSTNQIVVCRYDADTGTEEWTLAAYVDIDNVFSQDAGKVICDDTGATIGIITNLDQITDGDPFGPGMSAPAIDSAGNIWFVSAVELFNRFDTNGDGTPDGSDFDGALIRAIYDPSTFSYQLELVLEVGQVIDGLNSGKEYQIDFLGTANNNGGGASSNTIFSTNVAEFAWNNADISNVDPSDPITNGGLFFGTSITYDTDGDGRFNNPTSVNVDDELPYDESYSIGLYVGYFQEEVSNPCPPDLTGEGNLNFSDVSAFLAAFGMQDPVADFTDDGLFNFSDVSAFLAAFAMGCP